MNFDFIRYLPGFGKVFCHGQITSFPTKNMLIRIILIKTLEFIIVLTANQYTNFIRMHICLPIKIKSKTDNNNYVETSSIKINFFLLIGLKK